jgi:hypothetical protein
MASSERLVAGKRRKKAGIHHTYVGLLERGERKPTIDVAERVARPLEKSCPRSSKKPKDQTDA